ncbi:hypothetical protein [Winogradskyella sp.]|uniref:hypothetical protein n=1 Tax=Winogradskyella sp. TaxID=1883156 RepID=UPI0032296A9E
MKKLLNLSGAQELSKHEQRTINGGHVTVCGGTGGTYVPLIESEAECIFRFGSTMSDWVAGKCYVCH